MTDSAAFYIKMAPETSIMFEWHHFNGRGTHPMIIGVFDTSLPSSCGLIRAPIINQDSIIDSSFNLVHMSKCIDMENAEATAYEV